MRNGYIDDEADRFSRPGLLVCVLTIGLALAVLYNLVWVQGAAPGPRFSAMQEPGVIEIDASKSDGLQASVPATKAQVNVKGSTLPKAPAIKADPLVAAIERELIAAGNLDGPATGIPGQRVRNAIAAWQHRNGAVVTGAADQDLLERLKYARQIREAMEFTPDMVEPEAPVQTATAAPAPENLDLRMVQTGLAELGYRPGPITGDMTPETSAAIRAFETDRGLAPTGKITPRLLTALRQMAGDTELAPLQ